MFRQLIAAFIAAFSSTSIGWCVTLTTPNTGIVGPTETFGPVGENAEQIALFGGQIVAGGANFEASMFRQTASGWVQEASIIQSDGPSGLFGYAMALASDLAVVSAPTVNSERGAVYVFERSASQWSETARFDLDGSLERGQWLGEDVATNGEWIAAGAPRGRRPGELFLYRRSNGAWLQQASLFHPRSTHEDRFGWSVDISGDRMIVGAVGAIGDSAFVYRLQDGNWLLEGELSIPLPQVSDGFASQVAIDGNTAIVSGGINGEAYVYEAVGNDWNYSFAIERPVDHFGGPVSSFDVNGSLIAVGDSYSPLNAIDDGIVTIYSRASGQWEYLETITSPLATRRDRFGLSVSLDSSTLAVSAYGGGGSIFIYEVRNSIPEPLSQTSLAIGIILCLVASHRLTVCSLSTNRGVPIRRHLEI